MECLSIQIAVDPLMLKFVPALTSRVAVVSQVGGSQKEYYGVCFLGTEKLLYKGFTQFLVTQQFALRLSFNTDRVKAPGKGCNIVECYMLRPFAHPVACCCALLGVVAQYLKPVKLLATCKRTQQLPTMLCPFARGLSRKSGENCPHTACQT